MVETVDVWRGEALVVARAIVRQLKFAQDGRVSGQIRGPLSATDDPFTRAPAGAEAMTFRLRDGRAVEFRIYQAASADGEWAKLNGRLV